MADTKESPRSADPLAAEPPPTALGVDAAYFESMYAKWRADPASLPASWSGFFAGFAFARAQTPGPASAAPIQGRTAEADDGCGRAREDAAQLARAQSSVINLIYVYRRQGYLVADVDPLHDMAAEPKTLNVLTLERWNLHESDLDRVFDASLLRAGRERMKLREIIELLRDTYCRAVGVEYMHIRDRAARSWLEREMELTRNRRDLDRQRKLEVLEALTEAELFEKFTHSRYIGQKRFSLEGGETLISGLQGLVDLAPAEGIAEIVIGMAHRGRLNVLANVMGMSYEMIFSEFEGNFLPESVQGDGDVKYHKGYSSDWRTRAGDVVHLSLTANPSHLEAVGPVVQGRARAKQRQRGDTEQRKQVLPLLIHGDAAFAGQGVVAETFNLSQLPGYRTGGTIHVVVNNQIGFTTAPEEGRSTVHCTDVAKIVEAPIFHVNGDDPEAVAHALALALRFRQAFGRDVVVDLIGYRRHGHNETDDPAFTQPLLYEKIRNRPSVRELYIARLVEEGVIEPAAAERLADEFRDRLEQAHERARKDNVVIQVQAFEGLWKGMDGPFGFDPIDTRVEPRLIEEVARALSTVPTGFNLNPKVSRSLPKRLELASRPDGEIDWGFAELLSFGSLLREGTPVRLSGQDSARGTFSQRHAVWQDVKTQQPYIPLNHIHPAQARFCVYNSTLSEAAVLGFEYGYALSEPRMLIMWEAQFGDFVNGAQVIVDQFLTGAESKWQRDSGIVLLLPHGYEGQGPEHSNAYLERFLQGCAETNVQVCYPSTPAQYFHLLRRQMKRDIRLPLIVMTPKSLLRHKRVLSPTASLCEGGFEEFLQDVAPPRRARRLVLCSGKVYWDLVEQRELDGVDDVAIVRVEQFYPFHQEKLRQLAGAYNEAVELVWVQEEPQNRGGWTFMYPRLVELFGDRPLGYVGRGASASSATGSLRRHRQEQDQLVKEALHGALAKEDDETRRQSARGRRIDHRRSVDHVV